MNVSLYRFFIMRNIQAGCDIPVDKDAGYRDACITQEIPVTHFRFVFDTQEMTARIGHRKTGLSFFFDIGHQSAVIFGSQMHLWHQLRTTDRLQSGQTPLIEIDGIKQFKQLVQFIDVLVVHHRRDHGVTKIQFYQILQSLQCKFKSVLQTTVLIMGFRQTVNTDGDTL